MTEHMGEIIYEVTKHTQQATDRMFSTCEEARDEINKAAKSASNEYPPA